MISAHPLYETTRRVSCLFGEGSAQAQEAWGQARLARTSVHIVTTEAPTDVGGDRDDGSSGSGSGSSRSSYCDEERALCSRLALGSADVFFLPWFSTSVLGTSDKDTSTAGAGAGLDGDADGPAIELLLLASNESRQAFPLTLARMDSRNRHATSSSGTSGPPVRPLSSMHDVGPDDVPPLERGRLKRLSKQLAGLLVTELDVISPASTFTLGPTCGLLGGTLCQDVESFAHSVQSACAHRPPLESDDGHIEMRQSMDDDAHMDPSSTGSRFKAGMALRTHLTGGSSSDCSSGGCVGTLLLVDRTEDLVSPMSHSENAPLWHRIVSSLPRRAGRDATSSMSDGGGEGSARLLDVNCATAASRKLAAAAATPSLCGDDGGGGGSGGDNGHDGCNGTSVLQETLFPALTALDAAVGPAVAGCRRCPRSSGLYRALAVANEHDGLATLWRLLGARLADSARTPPHAKNRGAGAQTYVLLNALVGSNPPSAPMSQTEVVASSGLVGAAVAVVEAFQRSSQAQATKALGTAYSRATYDTRCVREGVVDQLLTSGGELALDTECLVATAGNCTIMHSCSNETCLPWQECTPHTPHPTPHTHTTPTLPHTSIHLHTCGV